MTNLQKVQAIVAKARSTEFPGERDVFLAKAEQLIVKWGLNRSATGIDGNPIPSEPRTRPRSNANWDDIFRNMYQEQEREREREQRRAAGNRYTDEQLYQAAKMRREGLSFKLIGEKLGIKATGHLSKTLKEKGYL